MDAVPLHNSRPREEFEMNISSKKIVAVLLGILAFGFASVPAQASIADEIVCSPADAQEISEIIQNEIEEHSGAIFNATSWNNYFAKNGYGRRKALSLFACVRNTLAGMDMDARAETDEEKQKELFLARDTLTLVYRAMGEAIAPNVPLPPVR
jgi:hypothetical protein